MTCNQTLIANGVTSIPRTCAECGLGPCPTRAETAEETPEDEATPPSRLIHGVVTCYALSAVYGPYTREHGEQVAQDLNDGQWLADYWMFCELNRLPGERKAEPAKSKNPLDDPEVLKLYEVLEQRQED